MHLSLRAKTIIILSLTLLVLAGALYTISESMLRSQFLELERKDAQENVQRVKCAISTDVNALAADAANSAASDELYAFASGRTNAPLDIDMIDYTMRNLHLHLLVITDSPGNILLARSMNLITHRGSDAPSEVLAGLLASAHLGASQTVPSVSSGLAQSAQALILVASAPLRGTQGTGPINGTLLMGRYLDDTFTRRIQGAAGMKIAVSLLSTDDQPATGGNQPTHNRPASINPTPETDVWTEISSPTVISSYVFLEDVSGSPMGVVKVEQPREIMRVASKTTSFFLFALLFISLIVGGMGLFVTEWLVFARLNRLVSDIAELGRNAKPGSRLQGKDRESELPGLAEAINDMLSALDNSRESLDKEREQLQRILETIGVGILLADTETDRVIDVNPVGLSILGRGHEETVGVTRSSILKHIDETHTAPNEDAGIRNHEWHAYHADGSVIPVLLTVVPLQLGERLCLLYSYIDISDRKLAEKRTRAEIEQRRQREEELVQLQSELRIANKKLRDLSLLDVLTGISNRRHFDQRLEREWARAIRDDRPLSLLMVDIDFFKAYNDTYGHVAGDRCLIDVASALARSMRRPADLVARYGGEEFVTILPNTTADGAIEVAEHLRGDIASLGIDHSQSSIAPYLTVSIGVATAQPTSDVSPYSLVRTADTALYRAKKEGRNRVHYLPVGDDPPPRPTW
ncbi:MAG: diguanylate cyclase [Actinobacteria bacterium]|nr:diguanylate cyclase [Actinomycetota bacterium]